MPTNTTGFPYENYVPFGEEWKKEIKKLPKEIIINMLAEKGIKFEKLSRKYYDLVNNLDQSPK